MSNSKDQSAHIDLPSNLKSNYIDCVLIPAAALYQPRATNPENAMWQLSPLGFSAITPFLPVYPSLSFSPSLIDTPLEHQMSSNHRKKTTKPAPQTTATAINITFATDTANPFKNLTKKIGGNLRGSVEPGRWSRETCE